MCYELDVLFRSRTARLIVELCEIGFLYFRVKENTLTKYYLEYAYKLFKKNYI